MADLVTLTSPRDDFAFTALSAPAQGRRRGGVIVVQEIFGLDRYVREDVERWSSLGFEVLAPSMFDRQEPGFTAEHDPLGMQRGVGHAMTNGFDAPISDVAACVAALEAKGPVFLVGYCYGGAIGWKAAAECAGLAAVSSYYGGRITDMLELRPRCPIILHFGRRDAHIPADETTAKIRAAHPEVPVFVYENSGHGFNNAGRPDSDAADAALARRRTLELFEAHGAA